MPPNFEFNGSNAVNPGRILSDHCGLRQLIKCLSLSSHGCLGRDTLHELKARCDRLLLLRRALVSALAQRTLFDPKPALRLRKSGQSPTRTSKQKQTFFSQWLSALIGPLR
jgi:hypothetical protein